MHSTPTMYDFFMQMMNVAEARLRYERDRNEQSYARLTGQRQIAWTILDALRPTMHHDSYINLLRQVMN